MIQRLSTAAVGAICLSAIGLAMSAAASSDRGATTTDTVLIMALSMAVTAGAQILPAISRSALSRLLWVACLVVVVYGHATFIAGSAHRAGALRATSVQQTEKSRALREQLDANTARPTATIAGALASATALSARATAALNRCEATTPGRCSNVRAAASGADVIVQALAAELAMARRADDLRAQLTTAAEQQDARRNAAATDPGAAVLATLTGLPADQLQTGTAILTAVLAELFTAFLWTAATPRRPSHHSAEIPHADDDLTPQASLPASLHQDHRHRGTGTGAARGLDTTTPGRGDATRMAADLDRPGHGLAAGGGRTAHRHHPSRPPHRGQDRPVPEARRPRDSPR